MVERVVNVLQVHPDLQLSGEATQFVCDLVSDVQQRLCRETEMLLRSSRRKTLTARTLQSAVQLLFPGELSRHAREEANRHVRQFIDSKK